MNRFINSALRIAMACTLGITATMATAQSAAFPKKPIKLVVPFNAGGPVDFIARAVGNRMSVELGQQVIVENRGGAATIIGWDNVAKSPADGYTLLIAGAGGRTTLPSIANLPFDPARDLVAVSRLANSPNVFVVNPALGPRTLAEFVSFARSRPGALDNGLAAPGTLTQFVGEALQREAGIKMVDVPYRGGAPAVTALLASDISFVTADAGAVMSYIQAGKLIGLAVADAVRLPYLPAVPTTAEAGMPKVVGVNVYGLFVPAGTPRAVIDRLATAARNALQQPDVKELFAKQGFVPESSSPEAFEAYLQAQTALWAPIARASGVRIN